MSLDLPSLFTDIGVIVKHWNLMEVFADSGLQDARDEIVSVFGDLIDPIVELPGDLDTWRTNVDNMRSNLVNYATARMTDRLTVLDEVNATKKDITEVLPLIRIAMVDQAATIAKSTVSAGSVTASPSNFGNGELIVITSLDGTNAPADSAAANPGYTGLPSELALPDQTFVVVCKSDSYSDGETAGEEEFNLTGGFPGDPDRVTEEGAGDGPSLQCVDAATILSNGTFEAYSDNTPNDWTIVTGEAGTTILINSTADVPHRGSACLQFVGNGVDPTIQLSQSIAQNDMAPLTGYYVNLWVKADASIGSGTLEIAFLGTDYTADSSEMVSILPGALPTVWTRYGFYVCPPANIPSDWRLSVRWYNTPQSAKNVYIDNLSISEVTFFAGLGFAVATGSTPWVRGDRLSVDVTNDGAGVFQEFFRRAYGTQLPSSSSPTILDSLAE